MSVNVLDLLVNIPCDAAGGAHTKELGARRDRRRRDRARISVRNVALGLALECHAAGVPAEDPAAASEEDVGGARWVGQRAVTDDAALGHGASMNTSAPGGKPRGLLHLAAAWLLR